jgi:GNAT superfamily N-acetyltransferase
MKVTPKQGVTIRPALPGDRDFVLAAARRLAAFDPPSWRSQEEIVTGDVRTLRAFFEASPAGSALLIAASEQDDRLGFAYLERLQDYFTLADHGHVGMLVVTEEAEGQGVGGALMRAAETWARQQGYAKLTLTTFEGNGAARAVYEHLGYAVETLRYVKML